jgi:siroheme synthase-like protein
MTSYYPAFLDISNRLCIVVGGSKVAEAKIFQLLKYKCLISVISPEITPKILSWAQNREISWQSRIYQSGDLENAFLVIAATDSARVNTMICKEAELNKVLFNTVDNPLLSNFIAPAIVRRGQVTLAISTNGTSPALARKFRELLTKSPLLEYADLAPLLSQIRKQVKLNGWKVKPDIWQKLITPELLSMIKNGREKEAKANIIKTLSQESTS